MCCTTDFLFWVLLVSGSLWNSQGMFQKRPAENKEQFTVCTVVCDPQSLVQVMFCSTSWNGLICSQWWILLFGLCSPKHQDAKNDFSNEICSYCPPRYWFMDSKPASSVLIQSLLWTWASRIYLRGYGWAIPCWHFLWDVGKGWAAGLVVHNGVKNCSCRPLWEGPSGAARRGSVMGDRPFP